MQMYTRISQYKKCRERESVCVSVYLCACNAQPAVFNAVPEGFNPDYQEYKVTESPSQPGLAYRLLHTHTHTHALPFPLSILFTHTRTHKQAHTRGVPASDHPLGGAVYPDRKQPGRCVFEADKASRMELTLLREDLRSTAPSLTYFSIFTAFLLPHLTFMRCLHLRDPPLSYTGWTFDPMTQQPVLASISVLFVTVGFHPPLRQLLRHLHTAVWSAYRPVGLD